MGERNTVVVDPWVRLPTAVTLAEGGRLAIRSAREEI